MAYYSKEEINKEKEIVLYYYLIQKNNDELFSISRET